MVLSRQSLDGLIARFNDVPAPEMTPDYSRIFIFL